MTATDEPDRKVIQCNYVEATSTVANRARAYVVYPNLGNGCDRVCVLVRSRRGRWVEKWESRERLGNFRAKTLPAAHPMYPNDRLHPPTEPVLTELRAAGPSPEGAHS